MWEVGLVPFIAPVSRLPILLKRYYSVPSNTSRMFPGLVHAMLLNFRGASASSSRLVSFQEVAQIFLPLPQNLPLTPYLRDCVILCVPGVLALLYAAGSGHRPLYVPCNAHFPAAQLVKLFQGEHVCTIGIK